VAILTLCSGVATAHQGFHYTFDRLRAGDRPPLKRALIRIVSVVDKSGTEVVHADITPWVTPAG
jgi:hypothetical protein